MPESAEVKLTTEFTSKKSVLQKSLDNIGPDILTDKFTLNIWYVGKI